MKQRTMNKKQRTENREHFNQCFVFNAPCSLTKGFTLFYSLILVSLLVALGLAIFNITYKQLILTSGARNSAQAFYAADTGLECALFWDLRYTGISSPAFGFYGDSLASGLAGYWRFDDGVGSDEARDFSGRGNDGELRNFDDDVSWIGGQIGSGALEFDGVDDSVVAEATPVTGSSPRTVILWVYPSSDAPLADQILVEWGNTSVSGGRYTVRLAGTNRVRVEIGGGGYTSSLVVAPDTWNMVAVVFDGATVSDHTIYVNSDVDDAATGALAVATQATGGLWIGNTQYFSGRAYKGAIDDVRVYNRALSESEIEAIYNEESNIIFTDPIEANTPGVMCGGALITDPANGWSVATSTDAATTVFDLELPDDRCASIEVAKDVSTTTIISRGYNTCNVDDPRRVERAIRAEY